MYEFRYKTHGVSDWSSWQTVYHGLRRTDYLEIVELREKVAYCQAAKKISADVCLGCTLLEGHSGEHHDEADVQWTSATANVPESDSSQWECRWTQNRTGLGLWCSLAELTPSHLLRNVSFLEFRRKSPKCAEYMWLEGCEDNVTCQKTVNHDSLHYDDSNELYWSKEDTV